MRSADRSETASPPMLAGKTCFRVNILLQVNITALTFLMGCFSHRGNTGLKSGRLEVESEKKSEKHLHTLHTSNHYLVMIWTKHLLTPGQEASVGVPNCLNVRNSWSISESPGKSGCRLTCHQLSNELSHPFSIKNYHLHKDTAQAPGVHCSSVEL